MPLSTEGDLHGLAEGTTPGSWAIAATNLSTNRILTHGIGRPSNIEHLPEATAPGVRSAILFETAPAAPLAATKRSAPAANVQIAPLLERVTLNELNAAQSHVFAQIAAKLAWQGSL